jgi:hypothetical protein
MDRRTFMQAVGAATGSVGLGGCLGDDEDPVPEIGDGPQRYDLPPYSGLTPAETQTGGGVVFLHLRLAVLGAVQRAAAAGRLPDGPLVEFPLTSIETVADAVETLSSYPFAAPLREAVIDAAGPLPEGAAFGTNGTVAPRNESVDGNTTTNETERRNETERENETESGIFTDVGTETGVLGADVTDLTLSGELLIFHGHFDRQLIADRYTEEFQQVDRQRGLWIYEGTGDRSGQAFAVADDMVVVPTENSSRTAAAETLLAHSLSGYINTLGRVVDDENGQWLFETTGPAALSLGVWGGDDPLGLVADSIGGGTEIPAQGPVFGSVDGFISALEVTVDNTGELSGLEGRFAGLFPESVPTEAELRSTLVSSGTAVDVVLDAPRAHLTTTFEES